MPILQSGKSDLSLAPSKSTRPWEHFVPVILEQARLYVLADKYGIDSLRQRIYSKLYRMLKRFELYDTGVDSNIEFVRFVYLNTIALR